MGRGPAPPLLVAGLGMGLFIVVALLGGAFSSAIFGTIPTGVAGHDPDIAHYVRSFQHVFAWTVPIMALSLILAIAMKELPLSEEMIEIARATSRPEY